jgi:hypothetical protein
VTAFVFSRISALLILAAVIITLSSPTGLGGIFLTFGIGAGVVAYLTNRRTEP